MSKCAIYSAMTVFQRDILFNFNSGNFFKKPCIFFCDLQMFLVINALIFLWLQYQCNLDLRTLGIWNISQPNGLAVPDASLHPVNSTDDVLELMTVGLMNRAVGATALNERSSRSHRFVVVKFVSVPALVSRLCILILIFPQIIQHTHCSCPRDRFGDQCYFARLSSFG